LTHTMSGSITAGDADGVTISPVSPNPTVARATINGVFEPALDLGGTQSSPTGTTPYPPSGIFSATTTATVLVTTLDAHVEFSLTGGGDQAALTGVVACAPVV